MPTPLPPDSLHRIDAPPPHGLDFHQIFAAVPTPLMVMDRELAIVYANQAYLRTTMRVLSEIHGRYVFDAFPESDRRMNRFLNAFRLALAGEANMLTTEPFSVPEAEGGGFREIVWTCTHTPIRGQDGAVAFVLQNAVDVTAKYDLDRRNEVLVRELDHRVKNSLASIQAIARQTFIPGRPPEQVRDEFLARLNALAGVQGLLVAGQWGRTDIRQVLVQALKPFGESGIRLDGPAAEIDPKQAQSLSMAIHELATNAAKYGALSVVGGRVEIAWGHGATPEDDFSLVWRESGGPTVAAPNRRGFGTVMLTRILPAEFRGTGDLAYAADGVTFRLRGSLGA